MAPFEGLDADHRITQEEVGTRRDRLGGVGQGHAPRIDDRLPGDPQSASRTQPERGLAAADLGRVDQLGAHVAIGERLGQEAGKGGLLVVIPRDEKPPGGLDCDARLRGIGRQQLIALVDEPRFERARNRVEAGVQDGRVGLRRPCTDVIGSVEEDHREIGASQTTSDGRSHHAGPDDTDICGPTLHGHDRVSLWASILRRAAASKRASRSSASAALRRGS